ncbi:hypothetical protein [Cohnella sp. REN36]|uniref:hypothetical protein n=1 Tax=Cohnella sp. REN36 TaxID=2887347 RepID=UPI001D135B16|nr:hypothetical protein [Cohnella sp. REN36]MCC3377239.1 hypothetical protein [Cohnella sp. REN36]
MPDREPEWYRRLRGNPLQEPGFTEEQMDRIERLAGERSGASRRRTESRNVRRSSGMEREGGERSEMGRSRNETNGPAANETESATGDRVGESHGYGESRRGKWSGGMEPVAGSGDKVRTGAGDGRTGRRPRRIRLRAAAAIALASVLLALGVWRFGSGGADPAAPGPSATQTVPGGGTATTPVQTPTPQSRLGEPIAVLQLKGMLAEQLPFSAEDVTGFEIYAARSTQALTVPKERTYVLLQNLYNLDLKAAGMTGVGPDHYLGSSESATLRIQTKTKSYTLDYDLATNTYGAFGGTVFRFYADDQVWLLMQGLLNAGSIWAEYDRLSEQSRIEAETRSNADEPVSKAYSPERLQVAGSDYNGWEKQFLPLSSGIRINDSYMGTSSLIQQLGNDEPEVLRVGNAIVFATDANKTSDGVGVGLTRDEVIRKLGEPNVKTNTRWDYRIGDYLKFHLLFEDDKVRFMTLTMPF